MNKKYKITIYITNTYLYVKATKMRKERRKETICFVKKVRADVIWL